MLPLLLAMLAPLVDYPDVQPATQCVVDNTVRMGKANKEPADTVYKAALSKCERELAKADTYLQMLQEGDALVMRQMGRGPAYPSFRERYKTQLESKAFAALLDARAK